VVHRLAWMPLVAVLACNRGFLPGPPAPPVRSAWNARPPVASGLSRSQPADGKIRPCLHDSTARKAAAAEVDALSSRIRSLPPDGEPAPLLADLRHLLDGPCFALARLEGRNWDIRSSLSLRSFWESGGEAWVENFLELDASQREGWVTWVPPTPRRALTLEGAPDHPLGPWLLCAERDEPCGDETEPWARRARTYFELFDSSRRARESPPLCDPVAACATRALAAGVDEPYTEWRSCLEGTAPTQTALPLGRFRAPHEGWILVRGRRGHYRFCDEARAYDLATGATYVARSCSGLALRKDGSVDGAQTDATRTEQTQAGRVDVGLLREAAWMMALSNETQDDVLERGFSDAIPDGIEPAAGSGEGSGSASFWGSSSQTLLDWRWIARGKTVSSGTLTWPGDYNRAARDHAVKLLDIAEASFREGCAPAPLLPQGLEAPSAGGVSPLDASSGSLRAAGEHLSKALTAIHAKLCP
jgi:hypothetical protein